jgi:hypothetical protein
MADLSRKKAWQQDPKLSACFALGESGQAVLEAVHSLHQVTPGIVSRLFHSEREATHGTPFVLISSFSLIMTTQAQDLTLKSLF